MNLKSGGLTGVGEVAPIERLSPDDLELIEVKLEELRSKLELENQPTTYEQCYELSEKLVDMDFPSIRLIPQTTY